MSQGRYVYQSYNNKQGQHTALESALRLLSVELPSKACISGVGGCEFCGKVA